MRRSLILLVLLLGCLYWLEPWLRRVNAAEAASHPWLPVLSPESWNLVVLGIIVLAVLTGLVLLVKLGLFIRRELGD